MSNSDILRKMYKNDSLVSVVNMSQEGMAMPANIETWTLDSYGRPTSIELKSGVTSIPEYWQISNHALSSVTMPGTVVSIGDYAFSDTYLDNIVVPNGCTTIGNNAFKGCTSLSSIAVPNTVTSIGNNAFSNIGSSNRSADISEVDLSNVMNLRMHCFDSSIIKGNFTISNEQLSGATSGSTSFNYGYSLFSNSRVLSTDTLNITVYADGRILPQNIFNFATYNSKGTVNITIYGTPTYLSSECFGGTSGCSVTFVDCVNPPDGNAGTSTSSPFYNFGGTVYVPNSSALSRWKNKYSGYSSHFKVIGT